MREGHNDVNLETNQLRRKFGQTTFPSLCQLVLNAYIMSLGIADLAKSLLEPLNLRIALALAGR
jgi:hypothetical protein